MASEEVTFNRGLGTRIARRRRERGLSQESLGSLLGLSRTSVTNIEAGRQNVVAYTVRLLARHLEVSADELLQVNPGPAIPPAQVFPDIKRPDERAFLGRALSTEEVANEE